MYIMPAPLPYWAELNTFSMCGFSVRSYTLLVSEQEGAVVIPVLILPLRGPACLEIKI